MNSKISRRVFVSGSSAFVAAAVTGKALGADKPSPIDASNSVSSRERRKEYLGCLGGDLAPTEPLDAKTVARVEESDYQRLKVTYRSHGETVMAYLLLPGSVANGAAVIAAHGSYMSGKESVMGVEPPGVCPYAVDLVRAGFVVLAPDAIAHGERRNPDPRGAQQKARDKATADMWFERSIVMQEIMAGRSLALRDVRDLARGIDYLSSLPQVDRQRIGCTGFSMGSGQTLFLTAADERIRVAVCICGLSTHKAFLREQIVHHWLYYVPGMLAKGFDLPEIASLIAPRPYLILNGKADTSLPLDGLAEVEARVKKAYVDSPERFQVALGPGAHAYTEDFRERMIAWFKKWL
ncbi:MAG TPA: dienelactone hydrolase family protein [Verrucomicrobiae bacterium]